MKKLVIQNVSGKSNLIYDNNICENKILSVSDKENISIIIDRGVDVFIDTDGELHVGIKCD